MTDRVLETERAVEDRIRNANAAQRRTIGAEIAELRAPAERAVHDIRRHSFVLTQNADGSAADIRADFVASIVEEAAVDHFESSAAHENRPAAIGVEPRGVSIDKRQVLHGELRVVLVLAHRCRPHLRFVAGILIQNADITRAAQRDFVSAVNHDFRTGIVEYFCRPIELDHDGIRAAIEGDDPAFGHGIDECVARAALRRAGTHDVIGFRRVFGLRFCGNRAFSIGIARRRPIARIGIRIRFDIFTRRRASDNGDRKTKNKCPRRACMKHCHLHRAIRT